MKNICRLFTLFVIISSTVIHQPIHAENEDEMDLFSDSAVLMDANSGAILYEKDKDRRMYPASITKIVSGLLAIEEGNLDDIVTVSQEAREVKGTRVYLEEGEEVTLLKLVQGLLINSGNDAGVAIAEHIDGSEKEFSDQMTAFVREEIGTTNTTFKNPHGLPDAEHITTAHDMALITAYAMENQTFREIVGTQEMEWVGESWDTILRNHHQLVLQRDDVTGVKNGFTNAAGFTLSTTAENEDIELVVVTLKAEDPSYAYMDTEQLIEYGYQFETEMIEAGESYTDSEGNEFILEEDLYFTVRKDSDWETEIATDGLLEVTDDSGDIVFEYQFPVEEEEESDEDEPVYSSEGTGGEAEVNPPAETEESGWFKPAAYTVGGVVLLIGIVLLVVYFRKNKRSVEEHSPITLETYKDDRRPWKNNW